VEGQPDEPLYLGVLPENAHAWMGTPGIAGHRDGRAFSTRFLLDGATLDNPTLDGAAPGNPAPAHVQRLTATASDADAGLALRLVIELTDAGLARMRATLSNCAAGRYDLQALSLAFPVPRAADELLDFAGRWGRERAPQRHPFTQGTYLRQGRRGRTGADATLLLAAGVRGFGWRHGEVWGVHTAWSGNHATWAERTSGTESVLAGGEVLLPGEVRLAPGEHYDSPWIFGSYGRGLDELSARFHRFVRAGRTGPRPVTGNSWEAVHFNHDRDRLLALADAFAQVGVERFVLDDGWFKGRRDDHAGLGDWFVDQDVWPDGLHPLVDHVRALGMQFGLWVEPEMINMDSDLARAHPEWVLAPNAGRLPVAQRHQQVLNLAEAKARAYIEERLDALIDEYAIDYLKWDHNRDLVEAGDQGAAGVHKQTLAAYAVMDHLRAVHPGLAIESCSSGGARADLGVLAHTDRIWGSDCTDAHERQAIQRFTGLVVPPEMIGAHICGPCNQQTGRVLSLRMRAITAMFADLGVEWDITDLAPDERNELAAWIGLYKRWRPLLHTGTVVHLDVPDPAVWAHGVVADDASEALFTAVAMRTSYDSPVGLLRLAGLDDAATYDVHQLVPTGDDLSVSGPVSGRVLAQVGVPLPDLAPDQPVLIAVRKALP
jgi:alpha-galactosidase